MKRTAWLFSGLWLSAVSLSAQGRYLVGFVDLQRHINGDTGVAYSAGLVECYSFFGGPETDPNCLIAGEHSIYDAETFAIWVSRPILAIREYSGFVRDRAVGDRCYRAKIEAAPDGGSGNAWGSPQRCFPDPNNHCPLLLDLGPAGLDLTGVQDPVLFDLDADGDEDRISWTAAGAADAFLVLDRNANGVVDDGTELFGNAAPQPPSSLPRNGFSALAVFDHPENVGNGDGRISSADEVFPRLRLWRDANHDGRSQSSEIFGLSSFGVVAFDLEAIESQARDRHGNRFRFRSKFYRSAGNPPGRTIDVFFVPSLD